MLQIGMYYLIQMGKECSYGDYNGISIWTAARLLAGLYQELHWFSREHSCKFGFFHSIKEISCNYMS